MPSLVVIFGRDRGRHFPLPRGSEVKVGRSNKLNHRLNDRSISREHLQFVHQAHNDQCIAVDLGSHNGTRINNKRLLHSQVLQDGDIVQIGYTLLVFVRVTFEANDSVIAFLNECEHQYAEHLAYLRDHAAMHADKDDPGSLSAGSMSGTLHLGSIFKKKR